DSKASVVLTSEKLAHLLPQTTAAVVKVDAKSGILDTYCRTNPVAKIDEGNLAYVIYTSGSTGWPKGVAMTHGALANVINWQISPPFAAARTVQFASLSFDVSFQEMISTWCS